VSSSSIAAFYKRNLYPHFSALPGATKLAARLEERFVVSASEPVRYAWDTLAELDNAGAVDPVALEWLYSKVKTREPEVVVETGVCNGASTHVILSALNENGSGHLYSIDYPYYSDESLEDFREKTFEHYGGAAIPSDKEPGWIVPSNLRTRWSLIEGKSQDELPDLLRKLESVDLFIHDSEHSYDCMIFEYSTVWPSISEGGLLISDDIEWNTAFADFSKKIETTSHLKASSHVKAVRK